MRSQITILNSSQQNSFYNPSTANNGGGYNQPYYEFEYGGIEGEFSDTSCGEFGSRYFVEVGGKSAYWGSMLSSSEEYSDFGEQDEEFLAAFKAAFGKIIPTSSELEEEEEYIPWVEYGTLKSEEPTNPADSITLGVYDADGFMWVEE